MNTHQSMVSPSESTLIEAWRVIETLAEDAAIMEMSAAGCDSRAGCERQKAREVSETCL